MKFGKALTFNLRETSMKRKMAVLLFVIVSLGFSLGILLIYVNTSRHLSVVNEGLLMQNIEDKRDVVVETTDSIENTVTSIFYDQNIRTALLSDDASLFGTGIYNQLNTYGDRFRNTVPGFTGYEIYKRDGSTFSYFNNQLNRQPVPGNYEELLSIYSSLGIDLIEKCSSPAWFSPAQTPKISSPRCFSNVYSFRREPSGEVAGIIIVYIKESYVTGLYGYSNGDSFLIGSDGSVISASGAGLPSGGSGFLDKVCASGTGPSAFSFSDGAGKRSAASVYVTPLSAYIVVVPKFNVLDSTLKSLLLAVILLLAIAVCYSVAAAAFFSNSMTKQLTILKDTVERARSGDLGARYTVVAHDEIGFLGNSFNMLLGEIQRHMEVERRLEEQKRISEVRFLQSQINPHLLYNTLDSVLYFISHGELETANRVIEDTSSYFKLSLSHGSTFVPVEKEIEHISYYMELQRICRRKEATLIVTGDEALLKTPILKITLQPIVENIFLHAFEGVTDDGEIRVGVSQADGGEKLVVTVEDNGIGMEAGELEDLRHWIGARENTGSHFGLWNTNKRLQTVYGPDCGLQVDSVFGEYTRVTVTIRPHGGKNGLAEIDDR